MWAWVVAFFTKHLWAILSVAADVLVVAFVVYSAWMVFHPKPTTAQKAQQIINITQKGLVNVAPKSCR